MHEMDCGYIKLHRKVLENGWLKDPKLWALWCWCLLKASHKNYKLMVGCQQVELNPGQFVFSRKMVCEELEITDRECRTRIDFLQNAGNMTIKTTNKFSIGTIVNWDTYQLLNSDERPSKRPATDQPPTSKGFISIYNKNKIYSPNSDEFRLSELLLNLILSRRNSLKKPDLQKWAVHIDRMIRIDKRPTSEIETIIRWCQADDFWQNNILSTDKLRTQYDKLALKAIKPESQWA